MVEANEFILQWPGKIVFGAGKLNGLSDEVSSLGERVFLVTTKDLTGLGLTDRLKGLLLKANLSVTVHDDVQPDPSCLAVDEAAEIAAKAGCDVIVSVGGGSAIDFGKGVAVAIGHDGPIWDYVTYTGANAKPVTDAVLPHVTVPTTAGTGSEVSLGTVLDNPIKHMKAALLGPKVFPDVALVDPELTYTMPRKLTAMTGFDALTHGMESFLNASRSNPASDMMALEAVSRIAKYLPKVIANGSNEEARSQMSWSATLAGIAMALSNVTVAHAMGLPLGSRLHVPHGLGLSRLLPVVLDYSWQEQTERCAKLADIIGAASPKMDLQEKAQSLIVWLRKFIADIGLNDAWDGAGIDEAMLDTLTDDVFAYMGRPVSQHRPVFTPEQIRKIYSEALVVKK